MFGNRYQTGRRWQGVRANIAMLTTYMSPEVKTAIDIGCNEGTLTCAIAELGVSATGFEQNSKFYKRALTVGKRLNNGVKFEQKLVSFADIEAMEPVDATLFLSVHHQIAAHSTLEKANDFLRALARKTRHQLFFQPACIGSKYGANIPFGENDFAEIEAYFNEVLKDEMPYTKTLGFAQNDIPVTEPMRPLIVYSREPAVMQAGRDTVAILEKIRKAAK